MIGSKSIFIGIGMIGLFISGYGYGKSTTANKYKATIAELETQYAKQEQARYQALAESERASRLRLRQETERGNSLAKKLKETQEKLIQNVIQSKRIINHVSENAREYCSGMPPDWVQSYNQALGLTTSDSSNTYSNTNTTKTSAYTKTSNPFIPWIQQPEIIPSQTATVYPEVRGTINKLQKNNTPLQKQNTTKKPSQPLPVKKLTSPKDILLHIQHYGAYCQSIAAQLQALIQFLEKEE